MTDSLKNIQRTLEFLIRYKDVGDDDDFRVAAYNEEHDAAFSAHIFKLVLIPADGETADVKRAVANDDYVTPHDVLAASLALVQCIQHLFPNSLESILNKVTDAQSAHRNN